MECCSAATAFDVTATSSEACANQFASPSYPVGRNKRSAVTAAAPVTPKREPTFFRAGSGTIWLGHRKL